MPVLRRIYRLASDPAREWDAIAAENASVDALLKQVILPLAVLAPLASGVGMLLFDASWDSLHGYVVPQEQIFPAAATTYFATVASILGLAEIFVALAPMYRSSRDYRAALAVATWGALPLLLAGAMMLVPAMALVCLVALCHTLYLYWVGARRVLHVPPSQLSEFVAIALLLLAAASVVIGALASSIGLV